MRNILLPDGKPLCVPSPPDVTEVTSRGCEECCLSVWREYHYPREAPETVSTLVDVGCNLGAFLRFAQQWWPALKYAWAYEPNADAIGLAKINTQDAIPKINFFQFAVTIDPRPIFMLRENWGGSGTHGGVHSGDNDRTPVVSTTPVRPIHPRYLPHADVLKIDAEGVELEVLEHYPYMSTVRVLLFEQHGPAFRAPLMRLAKDAGLTMVRGNPSVECEWDTQVWVRK